MSLADMGCIEASKAEALVPLHSNLRNPLAFDTDSPTISAYRSNMPTSSPRASLRTRIRNLWLLDLRSAIPEEEGRHRLQTGLGGSTETGDPKRAAAGIVDSIDALEQLFDPSTLSGAGDGAFRLAGTGLRDRLAYVRTLLHQANDAEQPISKVSIKKVGVAIAVGLAVVVVPLLAFSWLEHGVATRQILFDLASLSGGFADILILLVAWSNLVIFVERRQRVQVALERQGDCRALLHIIESHVGSKYFAPLWLVPAKPECVVECRSEPHASTTRFEDPSVAIHYLAIASSLSMITAKIAALYAQWLPRPDVLREADQIFMIALEIERNCLSKSILVRDGQLRPRVEEGVASDSA